MPNFSGVWTLKDQLQAVAASRWPLQYELFVWGSGASGQLGLNDTIDRSSPVQVGSSWCSISSPNFAIRRDRSLWAWGVGLALGLNDAIDRSSPVQVGILENWSQVNTCTCVTGAIKTDGTLWTWGCNAGGQLGFNDTVNRSSPVQVGALTNWYQTASGGLSIASIKTDGTLWTQGCNNYGQLGLNIPTNTHVSSPTQVGALTNWAQIKTSRHAAAIKTDGTLWMWGSNNSGALGINSTARRSSPVQVGALTTWSKVSTGGTNLPQTIAVQTNGTLWAWGYNGTGSPLGDNTSVTKSSPVQIGALTNWYTACTATFSSAAIKTDGTLWMWGYNGRGQLGQNNRICRSSPVQVGTLTNWYEISVGGAIFGLAKSC